MLKVSSAQVLDLLNKTAVFRGLTVKVEERPDPLSPKEKMILARIGDVICWIAEDELQIETERTIVPFEAWDYETDTDLIDHFRENIELALSDRVDFDRRATARSRVHNSVTFVFSMIYRVFRKRAKTAGSAPISRPPRHD